LAFQDDLLQTARRVWSFLTEPHPSIQGIRKRQQARLLSTLLLIVIPIFAFAQFTSDLVIEATLTFLLASIGVFLLYLGTRTRYYDAALIITLAGFTILPIVVFLYGANWQPSDLPRLMVWIFVALVGGSLLTRTSIVLLQGIAVLATITFIVAVMFQVPFEQYLGHLGTAVIIVFIVLVLSIMLESYIRQLDFHAKDSNRKARELEVYAQLLRHDLRNDLQAIMNSVELAEMFLELNTEKVKENLIQSLNLGQRMAQLLQVFSMPLEQPETNLVEHIKEIALQSQETYNNLSIEVSCTSNAQNRTFASSRLLPMVWTNIFRNAAQYCGDSSIVNVIVSIDDDDSFLVTISDNGPGIPEDRKDWLFKRGSGTSAEEKGVGLYLSKVVLESHNGSIELAEQETGTKFIVRIPSNSGS